ncbi:hypothetical protein CAOG_05304 [Capsaspora owczarzaki ATCC 30864]|uniref:PH domain-containing protein n=1 Tax=Capsaspora owczarzaki (strain ATCC 30864) TaxID=595528 RepID=A0A0D2VTS5_CAPO3|nr:hypothetical protein CAOG_05304 [Capsaspora owczarzaki ATCC 30864]KJE94702.1 hypothetical protein CAOG_005304 [Capsaspora owczarzaki ATCC 30864]|eukprot:XP_004346989.1 hypothetical protein CAOG_05304 [Capsaspora owczarzaki ATCC 30864]
MLELLRTFAWMASLPVVHFVFAVTILAWLVQHLLVSSAPATLAQPSSSSNQLNNVAGVLNSPLEYRHPTGGGSTTLAYHESLTNQPRTLSGYQRLVRTLEATVRQLETQVSQSSVASACDQQQPMRDSIALDDTLVLAASLVPISALVSSPISPPLVLTSKNPSSAQVVASLDEMLAIAAAATPQRPSNVAPVSTPDTSQSQLLAMSPRPSLMHQASTLSPTNGAMTPRPSLMHQTSTLSPPNGATNAALFQTPPPRASLPGSGAGTPAGYSDEFGSPGAGLLGDEPRCESLLEVKKSKGTGGKKSVGLSTWKTQYCVGQGQVLFLYNSKPVGSSAKTKMPALVSLQRSVLDENREYRQRAFVFAITLADSTEYLLQAATHREKQMWIQHLRTNACMGLDPRSSSIGGSPIHHLSPTNSAGMLYGSPQTSISPTGSPGTLAMIDPSLASAIATSQTASQIAAFNSLRRRMQSMQDDLSHLKSGMSEVSQTSKFTYAGLVDMLTENSENAAINDAEL